MRFLILIIPIGFFVSFALATSPPFSKVIVTGKTKNSYNKVGLFESGRSKEPLKTKYISDGEYGIDIEIPGDMKQKNNYFFTDMRFWSDKNYNNRIDPDESKSECHFIMWIPSDNKIYLKVYKGPRYTFSSSTLNYNHE